MLPADGGNVLPQFKELAVFLDDIRDDDRSFDLIATGKTPGGDPAQAMDIVSDYETCGATWWLEDLEPPYFGEDWKTKWTVETIRERILQGPPKISA